MFPPYWWSLVAPKRLWMRSDLGPPPTTTCSLSPARRTLGNRVHALNNSCSHFFSSTANKMPAVHHKLLLEEALQDSPQVGLCGLCHV